MQKKKKTLYIGINTVGMFFSCYASYDFSSLFSLYVVSNLHVNVILLCISGCELDENGSQYCIYLVIRQEYVPFQNFCKYCVALYKMGLSFLEQFQRSRSIM